MSNFDRDSLLGKVNTAPAGSRGSQPSMGALRWGAAKETSETKDLDNRGVLDLQQRKMEEQDKLLDLLGESVDRQKELAVGIGREVDEHIEILDNLDHEVRHTQTRLTKATEAVKRVGQKSSATCLWITICVLFLALMLVIFLAFYF